MGNENTGRRAWVKDAAIVFLVIMLILTFFSRTIMNHSLPEVSGQYAGYGSVATSVRGTGTVQTNMAYGVQIEETRQVKQVLVRVGDEVEAGDVLVLLEDEEGTELTQAREELSELEYSYREMLLSSESVKTGDSLEIIHLREDLEKAYASLASYEGESLEAETAKARVRGLETEIRLLNKAIKDIEERVTEARERVDSVNTDKSAVVSAEKQYNSALREIAYAEEDLKILKQNREDRGKAEEAYDSAEAELEKAQDAYDAAADEYSEAERELSLFTNVTDKTISEARIAMTKAQQEADDYKDRYERLLTRQIKYQEAEQNWRDAKEEYELLLKDANASPEKIAEALEHLDKMFAVYQKTTKVFDSEVNSARSSYERYNNEAFDLEVKYDSLVREQKEFEKDEDYVAAKKRLENALASRDKTKEALALAKDTYDGAAKARDEIPAVSQASINEAERSLDRDRTELEYLRKDYAQAFKEYTGREYTDGAAVENTEPYGLSEAKAELEGAEAELEAKETELEAKKDELEDAQAEYDELLENAPPSTEELNKSITTMERQLKTLLEAQTDAQESESKERQKFNLELEKASAAIEKQREKVAKLEEKSIDASVTARYAGTVTNVAVIAGDKANAGEDIVSIDVSGKGYTLTIPVTLEQSRYVKVGDTAKVLNYWGSGVTVKLAEIKIDRSNQSGRILEFDVDGAVSDGQSLNITVGERQSSYEYVVPNSAVREDANGTFIYIAEVKTTPIGNRFTARRLPVTVIAKDAVGSALDVGDGYNNEFVIVNASVPLTDGMQVRLVER